MYYTDHIGILPSTKSLSFQDNAYGKTLRQHHGWVVRGVFAVSQSCLLELHNEQVLGLVNIGGSQPVRQDPLGSIEPPLTGVAHQMSCA